MKREIHISLIVAALIFFVSSYHEVPGQQAVVKELLWDMDSKTIECPIQSLQKQDIELMIRSSDSVWEEKSKIYSVDKGNSTMVSFEAGETKIFKLKLTD